MDALSPEKKTPSAVFSSTDLGLKLARLLYIYTGLSQIRLRKDEPNTLTAKILILSLHNSLLDRPSHSDFPYGLDRDTTKLSCKTNLYPCE